MRYIILVLSCFLTLICNGQSFLSKYPNLTKKNLSEFFSDWKAYSDSVASLATKNDSLIDMAIGYNYLPLMLEGYRPDKEKYIVIPQYIKIERYYIDVDTSVYNPRYGFPYHYSDLKMNEYRIDSIIPHLPYQGLYLTSDINKFLSSFVGGLRQGYKTGEINKPNLMRLKKYIPVDYGHWGGYWWFTSFPLITNICQANNLLIIKRRTSWCSGDEIWFIKENGEFVKRKKAAGKWIE